MNRRDFLLTTSGLLLTPSALLGQESAKPASGSDVVFADFENGTYEGWTLEGNCWTQEPYSDRYFPGKITGFQGKRFLCTYHPTRGNNATGKAVSKEFTIEKPFINFLIGGGNYPGEACLNLVVDGKVVRTETGNDSAEFRQASWDVSEFARKRGSLEVLDKSFAADRGYIMVDHIVASHSAADFSPLVRFTPVFLRHSKIWKGFDISSGKSPFPFDLTYSDLTRLINKVVTAVHSPSLSLEMFATRDTTQIGKELHSVVDAVIGKHCKKALPLFTQQWLLAEAVCEYVRMNVLYDHSPSVGGTAGQPPEVQIARSTWKYIFSQQKPVGVCWGIAVCVRDLARSAGLSCDFVNGILRGFAPGPPPNQADRNHGVVTFVFDGGFEVPADVSSYICEYQNNHRVFKNRKTHGNLVLPILPEEWELFSGHFSADVGAKMDISGDDQNRHKLLEIPFEDWAALDTKRALQLEKSYQPW